MYKHFFLPRTHTTPAAHFTTHIVHNQILIHAVPHTKLARHNLSLPHPTHIQILKVLLYGLNLSWTKFTHT